MLNKDSRVAVDRGIVQGSYEPVVDASVEEHKYGSESKIIEPEGDHCGQTQSSHNSNSSLLHLQRQMDEVVIDEYSNEVSFNNNKSFLECLQFDRKSQSEFAPSGVRMLIQTIKGNRNWWKFPKAADIEDRNIFPFDEDVKPLLEVREKREYDIKTAQPDVESFIIKKFSENGVKNIFGKAQEEGQIHFPYIDVQVQSHNIGLQTFVVINGFTKGSLLSNGFRAQGQPILRIYKIDEKGFQKEPVLDRSPNSQRPLNNQLPSEQDYCPYKNQTPIAKNNNVIYYMQIHNERKNLPYQTFASLWKFDMEKGENGTESLVCDFEGHNTTTLDKYKSMYAAQCAFTTLYPHRNMSEIEFLRQTTCFFYYQVDQDIKPEFQTYDVEQGNDMLFLYMTQLNLGLSKGIGKTQIPYPDLKYNEGNVYHWTPYQEFDSQKIHLWIADPPNYIDITHSEFYKDQRNYKLAAPFYKYDITDGKTIRQKISINDQKGQLDKLLNVFGVVVIKDDENLQDENKIKEKKELMSINIINDNNNFETTVVYAYNDLLVFKRYRNQRYKPMKIYKRNELDLISKYAQASESGIIADKFINVFIKAERTKRDRKFDHKHVNFFFFVIDQLDSHGSLVLAQEDDEFNTKIIDSQSMREKYFVFDKIENKIRYDVFRIENRNCNPFVRFKVVGDRDIGLNIQFTRYEQDELIHDFKVLTEYSFENYKSAGVAWSSEMYKCDTNANKICQNIQWAQMSHDQIYCKIIEFQVSWPDNIFQLSAQRLQVLHELSLFQINPIGQKIVLFNEKYESGNHKRNHFYSMYNENQKIIGTQWIPVTDRVSKHYEKWGMFFQLKNLEPDEFRYNTEMVKSNFFIYYNEKERSDKTGFIVAESQIGKKLRSNLKFFQNEEILQILNIEIRCILNMYPTQMNDIIGLNTKIEDYDFLTSIEVLDRQCIADYFLRQPVQILKFIQSFDFDKQYQNRCIIQSFIDLHGNQISHYEEFQRLGIYRSPGCISVDMFHSNTLSRCFDNGKKQIKLLEKEKAQNYGLFKIFRDHYFAAKEILDPRNKEIKDLTLTDQDQIKEEAILSVSGQHLLHYVLKKKPNLVEHDFINNIMDILIEMNVELEEYFENEMEYGQYVDQEFKKNYANLVDMKELPDSSRDRQVIRVMGWKNSNQLPFDHISDQTFVQRYFEVYNNQKEKEIEQLNVDNTLNRKQTMQKSKNRVKLNSIWNNLSSSKQDLMENETDFQSIDLSPIKLPENTIQRNRRLDKKGRSNLSLKNKQQIEKMKKISRYQQISKTFLTDQSISYGKLNKKQSKVQYFIIDQSSLELENKLIQLHYHDHIHIKQLQTDGLYNLAIQQTKINDAFGSKIEFHVVRQKIIDSLFFQTKIYFQKLQILYLFYIIPFLLELLWFNNISDDSGTNFYIDESKEIIICNLICMGVTTIFFILELIQIKILKEDYFERAGSHHEIIWFVIQIIYFFMKISNPRIPLPIQSHVYAIYQGTGVAVTTGGIIIASFLNITLLFISLIQITYFMTVYHQFGQMIELVTRTINSIKQFLVFFIILLCISSVVIKCLGFDFVDNSQREPDVWNQRKVASENNIWVYLNYIFQNAVGQLMDPTYFFWASVKFNPQSTKSDIFCARFMIMSVWVAWIFFILFLFIVLCNFLIAYISQSYEDVLEDRIPNAYVQRCTLNEEFFLVRNWYYQTFYPGKLQFFDVFLLSFDTTNNLGGGDKDMHLGVIKKVQDTLRDHKTEVHEAIQKNGIEMNRVQDEMINYRWMMSKYKKQLQDVGNQIINEVAIIIEDNNKKIPEALDNMAESEMRKEEIKRGKKRGNANILDVKQKYES